MSALIRIASQDANIALPEAGDREIFYPPCDIYQEEHSLNQCNFYFGEDYDQYR